MHVMYFYCCIKGTYPVHHITNIKNMKLSVLMIEGVKRIDYDKIICNPFFYIYRNGKA